MGHTSEAHQRFVTIENPPPCREPSSSRQDPHLRSSDRSSPTLWPAALDRTADRKRGAEDVRGTDQSPHWPIRQMSRCDSPV